MGLFSRTKKTKDQDVPEESAPADALAVEDSQDARKGAEGGAPEAEDGAEGPGLADPGRFAENPSEPYAHLEPGPYDEADAPEAEHIDLGGLRIPRVKGLELRMEMDQRTKAVTGANLVLDGSSLQIQAFAAPRSRGLWDEVRTSLRSSITSQGGTAETRTGTFGTELVARLPMKRADGRTGYRPVRFIGVDGPRWFVRAILSGSALSDREQTRRFETLLSRIVVVRGKDAMAPQELIPLTLPGHRAGVVPAEPEGLDPLARGPEITEIG